MEERVRRYVDDGGEENIVVERGRKQGGEFLKPIDEDQKELFLCVKAGKSVDRIDVVHSHCHEKRDDEVRSQAACFVHVVLGKEPNDIDGDRNTLQENGLFFVVSDGVEQRDDPLSDRLDLLALN